MDEDCPGMVIVLEMAIITGRATVIWRMSVLGMVTILGMVAFLRSVLVLRIVNALVMVTTSGYFLFPPYGHKEGKGDNEDAWEIKKKLGVLESKKCIFELSLTTYPIHDSLKYDIFTFGRFPNENLKDSSIGFWCNQNNSFQ